MLTYPDMEQILFRASRLGLTTVTDGQAHVWTEVLNEDYPTLDYRLALDALHELAARAETIPARGIRPFDLASRARMIARERQARIPVVLPPGLSPVEEIEWKQAWATATSRGATAEQASEFCETETGIRPSREITSTMSPDIKAQLAKFRKGFGKENKNAR